MSHQRRNAVPDIDVGKRVTGLVHDGMGNAAGRDLDAELPRARCRITSPGCLKSQTVSTACMFSMIGVSFVPLFSKVINHSMTGKSENTSHLQQTQSLVSGSV